MTDGEKLASGAECAAVEVANEVDVRIKVTHTSYDAGLYRWAGLSRSLWQLERKGEPRPDFA
ncbi:MAG TPA: hypothetical protein GXX40_00030 [Firmicutes bacterium]|nr:hypothetical protein [Bacillota bacterium]